MTTPTIPFYPVTHDDGTNIVSALNSIASARRMPLLIADAFSNLTNYEVNDYVIYENNLYRFTVAHPAGSWNYSQVVRVSVGEEFSTLNNEKVNNSAVAPEFRNDANYAVGDVVSYKGGLYRYLSPHIEGDWDRSEVVATNAISEGGGGGGGGTGVGDEITFDGDNMIITSSGRSIESLESSIAIVANGDSHPLINSGEYVYVKMHDTLPEGLYTANSNIVEDGALTTSNLSSVSKGGLNKLNEKIKDINIVNLGENLNIYTVNGLVVISCRGWFPNRITAAAYGYTTIGTIPSNFRKPTITITGVGAFTSNADKIGIFSIDPGSGKINVFPSVATDIGYFTAYY